MENKYLIVSSRFPLPSVKGDQLILINRLKLLSESNKITLCILGNTDGVSDSDFDVINRYCDVVFLRIRFFERIVSLMSGLIRGYPLQCMLYKSHRIENLIVNIIDERKIDVVDFFLVRTWFDLKRIRNDIKVVVDMIDSLSLNALELIKISNFFMKVYYKFEYPRLNAYEKIVSRSSDAIFMVSQRDIKHIGMKNVFHLPNGVDTDYFLPATLKQDSHPTIVFSGNMAYLPNITAVEWFLPVFTRLKDRYPDLVFKVIGASVSSQLRSRLTQAGVEVLGYVKNIAYEISLCNISIAPVFTASGMQNKVVEAMSCGLPVVISSKISEPFDLVVGKCCFVGETADDFFNIISNLLDDKRMLAFASISSRRCALEHFSWVESIRRYENIISRL